MPQSFAALAHHFIFSTKDREPLLAWEIQPRLFDYMGGILGSTGCVLEAAGGMPDHVHLLVSMDREHSVAEVLRTVKAGSSRWIHEEFSGRLSAFAWQAGYGAFSVSHSHRERVKAYLANQAEHHRRMTFQEEYVLFLKRHGIAFDARYLWD